MGQGYPADAVAALAERLHGAGAVWVIGGSTGLAIRGAVLDKAPRDLDIYADEEDAGVLHERLARFALDSPVWSETDRYRSILSHYEVEGTVVELVGAFRIAAAGSVYTTRVRQLLEPLSDRYQVLGHHIKLVPLAHELIFNVLRDRPDRCAMIGDLIARDPVRHLPAVREILAAQELSEAVAARILRYARFHQGGTEQGAE